jgi:hypothetical protein
MQTTNATEPKPGEITRQQIHLPAPTAWPILLSMGLVLSGASLVTNYGIGILGIILTVVASVGWFRDVLPQERHETIETQEQIVPVTVVPVKVRRIQVDETHRAQLPLKTFPISSGIKGGIAGGIAMIIPAEIYGILRFHSIWYVINLLGGAGVAGWTDPMTAEISPFHLSALLTATAIQIFTCLLVGLLYGAFAAVAKASHPARRHHRASSLDSSPLQRTRSHQSLPGSADRLVVVRGIASLLWSGRRLHCHQTGRSREPRAGAAVGPSRCGSSRAPVRCSRKRAPR